MTQTADFIIVGGGVTGLLSALFLQELTGGKVILLERHYMGSGQSHRAAGVCRALVREPAVAKALSESLSYFQTFSERFDEELLVHAAGYHLLAEPEQSESIEEAMAAAGEAGCEAQKIDSREAAELQPGLREDDQTLYVFEPGAIHLDPMPTLQAIRRLAQRRGVKIKEGCEVNDILLRGDEVCGVESSCGRFHGPQILMASSFWGAGQLSRLGVDLPVYSHRAEMAFFQVPSKTTFTLRRILSDARPLLYLRPEGDQQMFVGRRDRDLIESVSDMEAQDPDQYKQTAEFESVVDIHRRLAITLPPMQAGFVHRTYACVYDMTPDSMPVLDRASSVKGLYFAIGFSGGGFSLSPWVGRAMAEFMVHQNRPAQIDGFDLNRFAEGRAFDWSNVARTSSS